jgi:hypothetical protein
MRLIPILLLGLILAGCAKREPARRPVEQLHEHLERSGSVVFKSWNGESPQGADCETDITLRWDGSASLVEHGYGLQEFTGSYSIMNANKVMLTLEGYPEWPTMILAEDKSSLILLNETQSTAYIFGKRSGSVIWGDPNKFWPFRMESPDKKQESQQEH